MRILTPHYDDFHLRNLFHEIDTNGNGIIDVDEFLSEFDTDILPPNATCAIKESE
jgi:Ca2+-binding EF-hand superfamily protein